MISNHLEIIENIRKRLQNQKKLQLIRDKRVSGNEQIQKQKIVMNQPTKDTRLNKVFKLMSRLPKAVPDIP